MRFTLSCLSAMAVGSITLVIGSIAALCYMGTDPDVNPEHLPYE